MALSAKSLFLYGFQVGSNNFAIDFRAVALETPRQAILRRGTYSLTTLGEEIARALKEVDPARTYTVSANRTVSGGTQNRVTISSNGAFFELLFGTGPRVASSAAGLIGFNAADYTGGTSYQGSASAGTAFVPSLVGYQYLSPEYIQKNFGSVNVSASGLKESIVWQIQEFWQVQFKYIPEAEWVSSWLPLLRWMIQQRPLEFTPEISSPNDFLEGTLETTTADGRGLAYNAAEMLPQFPNLYDSGPMKFRKRIVAATFI